MIYEVSMIFDIREQSRLEFTIEASTEQEAIEKAWDLVTEEDVLSKYNRGASSEWKIAGQEEAKLLPSHKAKATVYKPIPQTFEYGVNGKNYQDAVDKATEELFNKLDPSVTLNPENYVIEVEELTYEVDEPEEDEDEE